MSFFCRLKLLLLSLPFGSSCPPQYKDVTCNGGILSTPTYGLDGAVFSFCASIEINAPVQDVSNTILNFRNYKEWNTFIYDADVPANIDTPDDVEPGLAVTSYSTGLTPGSNNTGTDVVTFVDRPFRTAWKNDQYQDLIGVSEHVSTFCPMPGGKTRYTHWQTEYMPQSSALLPIKDNFQHQFEVQTRDLKAYVEKQQGC